MPGWTDTGGLTVTQAVASHDAAGHQELFARITNAEVWAKDNNGGWFDTHGSVNSFVATDHGIAAIANGDVWTYQSNTGWRDTHTANVVQIVATHNPRGGAEVFARLKNGTVLFNDIDDGSGWLVTSGAVDTIVAAQDGIVALASGRVYIKQDNTGWVDTGANYVVQVVVAPGVWSYTEILYARLSDGSVWESGMINTYQVSNTTWLNTGKYADSIVGIQNGVAALAGGDVFVHSFGDYSSAGDGWFDTHAGQVIDVVVSQDSKGEQELFVQTTNGAVYVNIFNNYVGVDNVKPSGWFFTGGYVV